MLDEPTTGVDAEAQEALAVLLDRLHSPHVTILYVSHEFRRSSASSNACSSCAAASSSTARPSGFPASGTTRRTSMLELEFMRLSFAAGIVVGLLAPTVGFFLVQRRLSLVEDGSATSPSRASRPERCSGSPSS